MCHNYEIELHNEQLLTFYFIAKCLLSEIPHSCNNHTLKDWSKAKSICLHDFSLCFKPKYYANHTHLQHKRLKISEN